MGGMDHYASSGPLGHGPKVVLLAVVSDLEHIFTKHTKPIYIYICSPPPKTYVFTL